VDISTWDMVGRLLLAAVLGGLIGLERELDSQPAGFRTHLLVALGAALFTVAGASVEHNDPTRVAAQVASGIGFLGAGAILQDRGRVHGLTTAASLWVSASLGVAAGLGEWVAGVTVAGIAVVVLTGLKHVERRMFPRRRGHEISVELTPDVAMRTAIDRINTVIGAFEVREVVPSAEGRQRLGGVAHLRRSVPLVEIAEALSEIDGIATVEVRS